MRVNRAGLRLLTGRGPGRRRRFAEPIPDARTDQRPPRGRSPLSPGNAGQKCDGIALKGPADSALPGGDVSGPRLSVRIVLTERPDPLSVLAATGLQR